MRILASGFLLMKRKLLIRITVVLAVLLFFLPVAYFGFRNSVLHLLLDRIGKRLETEYSMSLTVRDARFSGLSSVCLSDISLVPQNGDTLLHLDSVRAEPSFSSLLTGMVRIKSLYTQNAALTVVCRDGNCNYQNFLHHTKRESDSIKTEKNYAAFLNRMLRQAFNLAPQQAEVKNIFLSFRNDTLLESVLIPSFTSSDQLLQGTLVEQEKGYQWECRGTFSQRRENFDIEIFPLGKEPQNLPFLKALAGTQCRFDTLHIALYDLHYGSNVLSVQGHVSIENVSLQHKRISDDEVKIPHAAFDYSISVTKNSIALDSSSAFVLNKIKITPFARLTNDTSKVYELKLKTDVVPATDFFSSLPEGMFDVVRDLEAGGTLQYSLDFLLNSAQPDSVVFESSLRKDKLRMRDYGESNLLKMNGEFTHAVYERDRYVRSFQVGPSNPYFTPLDQVAVNFRNAVLTSEDGSFFYHNGFNEDAFRRSIAQNFVAGKFVRGGSTISMQLVKNVFLTRKKTIARKAEEALIVWLIENNRLCSKERMFEVYLNIIELGPNIYGIGEAAPFYFSKKPADLTLAESIFLASLLPRPKGFKYSFDANGNLKPYLADYYRVVSNFMLRKNLITQPEHDQLIPAVELKGPAREMVVPSDTIPETEDEFQE